MAFGISTASGEDFLPILKFNAKAGRMYRPDRKEVNGEWQTTETEITQNAVFIADLANVEIGWIDLADGNVDFQMVPLGQPKPPKPQHGKHKEGFRMRVKLGKDCGGDVREFASTAGVVISALGPIEQAYNEAPEKSQGQLPIIRLAGCLPIQSKHGTNYQPQFEIIGWADRPEDLTATEAAPAQEQQAAPVQTNGAATHAPPPQTAQEPVTANTQF
ncbi:MAG: hypothetical protein ACPGSI_16460 [Pikeienuella sp.]